MFLNHLPRIISHSKKTYFAFISPLIVLAFSFSAFAAAAGDFDRSFGQDGIAIPNGFSGSHEGHAIAVQPDGKIVVAGIAHAPPYGLWGFALVRYLPNGALDPGFGTNGQVLTPTTTTHPSTSFSYVNDVAVLPDGKIIVAGSVRVPDPTNGFSRQALAVLRYNADGSIDTTFHDGGKFIYPSGIDASAEKIAVQPDGKFVIAGYGGGAIKATVPYRTLLFRFAGTTLDFAFQNGATAIPNGETQAYSLAVQPADGKIVVGGKTTSNGVFVFSLTRYNADGTIDTSFGNGGWITRPGENLSEPVEILIQPDGKIVAVSSVFANSNARDFAVLRFQSNGTFDPSFGSSGNGKVITAVTTHLSDTPVGAALQPDGKIVVAGYTHNYSSSFVTNAVVLRYNPSGALDLTFGIGGIVRTPSAYLTLDMALQPDGKILTAGNLHLSSTVLAGHRAIRYLAFGQREFDFDGDRLSDVGIFRPGAAAEWYWLNSSTNQSGGVQFGIGSDKIVPADYDGDGKTDVAVFRGGNWYRLNSSDNQFVAAQFGIAEDKPVPADYDADGRADPAVYRNGNWYILNSRDNSFRAEQFGVASDKPVIGDFDGDGKNDLAVYRDGTWYAQRSREGFFGAQFGISTDKPVTGDYDGDGKTDLAVYRPADGTWYLLRSHLGFTAAQFGIATDKPVPADYDNDGRTDLGVYRDGNWYVQQSTGGFRAVQFGAASDLPVSTAFVP